MSWLQRLLDKNISDVDFLLFGEQGELREAHNIPISVVENSEDEFYDAEILDEITTSRGELKHRTVSVKEDRSQMVNTYIISQTYS